MSRKTPVVVDSVLLKKAPLGHAELGHVLRNVPLAVGVSGGADSVALLVSLVRLRRWLGTLERAPIVALHVEHGIRGAASRADATFVKTLAAELGIPFHQKNVKARKRTDASLEMSARELRRGALCEMARKAGCEAIALAHHAQDQLETFFLRLDRGASAQGLSGMRPIVSLGEIAIVRPLLETTPEAIREFLTREGIAWREDATNAQDDAKRNRVRHHLVPALTKTFGASFPATLARSMALLADDADAVASLAPTPGATIAARDIPALAAPARTFLANWLYARGVPAERVTRPALDAIRALAAANRGASLDLGAGYTIRLRRGVLIAEK